MKLSTDFNSGGRSFRYTIFDSANFTISEDELDKFNNIIHDACREGFR